jgi:acetyltransferase
VLAVDAELALRPAGEVGELAIPPYPAELERPFRTRSGEVLTIRPIRPEDAAAQGEAFRRLDPRISAALLLSRCASCRPV